jgi:hypothetical protein
MNMHQFSSSTRRVLSAIPMVFALLTGATFLMAAPCAIAAVATTSPPKSIVDILVTGTVPGPPEAVNFTKVTAEIGSTLLPGDPATATSPATAPRLMIDITFIKAPGVGATTKLKYTAEAGVTKIRDFAGNMVLEITFPFNLDKRPLNEALSGLATFNLTFDTNGVITGASGTISANTF